MTNGRPLIRLAWRQLRRDSRLPELRLLFAALLLAVAAVTTVGFFTERVGRGLAVEAQRLLGGDLVLLSDQPPTAERRVLFDAPGVTVAETRSFPSMVLGAGRAQLADIKAVGAGYPLRGELQIRPAPGAPAERRGQGPAPGEIWLDERLAGELAAPPGASVRVGEHTFRVTAILALEPDRGMNIFSFAPRLMMNLGDLAATGLEQPGARIAYRLLASGPAPAIAALHERVVAGLKRGERLEDVAQAPPEMRRVLERAQRFLGLASALTVILAAVAVALAARRYQSRQLDTSALLRCLGLSQGGLLHLHGQILGGVAVLATLGGGLLGFLGHFVLVNWLGGLLGFTLPAAHGGALAVGGMVAAVLLFGFAMPPLLQLARVSALRVLRRELAAPGKSTVLAYAVGWLALAGLLLAAAGDLALGLWLVAGFSAALAAYLGLAHGLLALVLRLPWRRPGSLRLGLAGLRRHRPQATLQIVALAVGLMALLLLGVTRGELLAAWQNSVPPDAPNRFVINIQPEQRDAVLARLTAGGRAVELAPMVRGRLLAIGGRPVSAASYPASEQAQRLVEREFNLSWRATVPPGNEVLAGRWLEAWADGPVGGGVAGPAAGRLPELSVEEGLARTLGIALGDVLRFSINGRELDFAVSSLRRLAWDSMRVNFFVLAQPGVLDPAQASFITSFYLPPAEAGLVSRLVEEFPNLSVIDTAAILEQLRGLIGRVAGAVQFVFLFTLLAGLVVVLGSLSGALDERRREWALLSVLGGRQRELRRALVIELAIVGGLAGSIAAVGASVAGQIMARRLFQFDLPLAPALLPLSALGGALLVVLVGLLALRRVAASPPSVVLRAGD